MPLFDRLDAARVYLRPYRIEDADWYAAMAAANRDHLRRYESGNHVFRIDGLDSARAVMTEFARGADSGKAHFLGVFRHADDRFVAQLYVGLSEPDLPGYTIGYFAEGSHQGHGYVREALVAVLTHLFEAAAAHRVTLWSDDGNLRSRRVAEAAGLRLEGHSPETKRHADGSLSGTVCYGALAREWRHPVSGSRRAPSA